MATTAATIIAKVRAQLIDDGVVERWSDAELLRYMSDGQRTISTIMPHSVSVRAVVQLTEGTLQTLPTLGHRILRAIRNMGTAGTTPGRSIRLSSLDDMDALDPNWHAETKVTEVRNFMVDPEDEAIYYVYPPSNGLGYIQINYNKTPSEMTLTTDEIEVEEVYQTPLFDYVMWRAHLKDSEMSAPAMAQMYLQAFQLFMQVKQQAEANTDNTREMAVPNAAAPKG